jgi:protein phosphatase
MQPQPDPRRARNNRIKALLLVVFLLLLLVAAGLGTRWYVLRQYYVGEGDNGEVSVFRGVTGSVFGFDLHRRVEGSCPPGAQACEPITVDDLKVATRGVVRNGITDVDGLEGAREAIRRLRTEQTLPFCPKGDAENSTGTTNAETTTAVPTTTATSTEVTTSTTVEGTPLTTPVQKPGTDCRKGQ